MNEYGGGASIIVHGPLGERDACLCGKVKLWHLWPWPAAGAHWLPGIFWK